MLALRKELPHASHRYGLVLRDFLPLVVVPPYVVLQVPLRRETLAAVRVTAFIGLFSRVNAYMSLEVSLLSE